MAVLPDEAKYGLNPDAAVIGIGLEKLLEPKTWSVLSDSLPVSLPKFDIKVDMLSLSAVSHDGLWQGMDRSQWRSDNLHDSEI